MILSKYFFLYLPIASNYLERLNFLYKSKRIITKGDLFEEKNLINYNLLSDHNSLIYKRN